MKHNETVGIQDGLTVTVKKSECQKSALCQSSLASRGVHGVRILKNLDMVYVLEDNGTERRALVNVAIDWDGRGIVIDAHSSRRLPLNKLRKICPDCGGTVHSWRSENAKVPKDGVPEE